MKQINGLIATDKCFKCQNCIGCYFTTDKNSTMKHECCNQLADHFVEANQEQQTNNMNQFFDLAVKQRDLLSVFERCHTALKIGLDQRNVHF